MIEQFKIGDKVKIVDNNSQNVIIDDIIVNEKEFMRTATDNVQLKKFISFDNRYYFYDNPLYSINKSDTDKIIPLSIPSEYCVELWRNSIYNDKAQIYKEYTIDELDPEVYDLVTSLNKIDGIITTGSCSGHNHNPLYIDIKFNNFNSIRILLSCLQKFKDDFVLTSTDHLCCNNDTDILLQLQSIKIGNQAYKAAERLSMFLEIMNE